jgi:hypothetical protein
MKTIRVISILCIGFLLSGQSSEDDSLDAAFDKDVLIISASEHACYLFDIYVATTPAQQTRGLMYVRYLPDTTGMLFVYLYHSTSCLFVPTVRLPISRPTPCLCR